MVSQRSNELTSVRHIPAFLYSIDFASLVDYCWKFGAGNNFKRWTDRELEISGLTPKNLRNILDYQHENISTFSSIMNVFGANFSDKEEWKKVCENSLKNYKMRRDKKRNPIIMEDIILNRFVLEPSGTWIYGICTHDGREFDVGPQMIAGLFVISELSIKYAYANGVNPEKMISRFLNNWEADELAVGHDLVYVKYRTTSHSDFDSKTPEIKGIFSAKLITSKPLFGSMPIKGTFYDLNATRSDWRGHFYAERVIGEDVYKNNAHDIHQKIWKRISPIL